MSRDLRKIIKDLQKSTDPCVIEVTLKNGNTYAGHFDEFIESNKNLIIYDKTESLKFKSFKLEEIREIAIGTVDSMIALLWQQYEIIEKISRSLLDVEEICSKTHL